MVFDKEHGLADEYYNYKSDDVGFMHLVGLDAICYYVSFKKVDKIFNGDHKLVRFRKLLNEYDLAAEGRPSFKFVIEKAPSWLDYYFEFVVYSKEEKY